MIITFLGTRGYVDITSRRHKHHTSTMIMHHNKRIMIDCGQDWLKKIFRIKPDAIILTHSHPDHAAGLAYGAPCPVYATRQTWHAIKDYLIDPELRHTIKRTQSFKLFGVIITPISVVHSLLAPAIAYRIEAQNHIVFYSGDIAYMPKRAKQLKHVTLYIGDGSTLSTPLIRKKDDRIYGHTTIKTQLAWCRKSGVERAIFTHLGTPLIQADGRKLSATIKKIGKQRGVNVRVAYDGLTIKSI